MQRTSGVRGSTSAFWSHRVKAHLGPSNSGCRAESQGCGAALRRTFRTGLIWPRLHLREQALMRSQSGPLAGVPFSCVPSSAVTRFEPFLVPIAPVRVKLPVWPSACPYAGVLGRRGFSIECREDGGVSILVRVQDLDLPPRDGADNRRLEVVGDSPRSTALSSRSTPLWCRSCTTRDGPSPRIERAHTPNLPRLTERRVSWWWLAKWAAGGPERPSFFYTCWHTPRSGMSRG